MINKLYPLQLINREKPRSFQIIIPQSPMAPTSVPITPFMIPHFAPFLPTKHFFTTLHPWWFLSLFSSFNFLFSKPPMDNPPPNWNWLFDYSTVDDLAVVDPRFSPPQSISFSWSNPSINFLSKDRWVFFTIPFYSWFWVVCLWGVIYCEGFLFLSFNMGNFTLYFYCPVCVYYVHTKAKQPIMGFPPFYFFSTFASLSATKYQL